MGRHVEEPAQEVAQGLVAAVAALVLLVAGFVGANLLLSPDAAVSADCTVTAVQLESPPHPSTAGELVRLNGHVTSEGSTCDRPLEVSVYAKQYGDGYRLVARVPVAADGTWAASHRPGRLTAYLARVAQGSALLDSPTVKHEVATRITLRSPAHGAVVRGEAQVLGWILPAHAGAPVTIGYRRDGRTTRIGATSTAADGTFRASVPVAVGRGALVVTVPRVPGSAPGHRSVAISVEALRRLPTVAPRPSTAGCCQSDDR